MAATEVTSNNLFTAQPFNRRYYSTTTAAADLVADSNRTIASTTTQSLVAQLANASSIIDAGDAGLANKPYALALAIVPLLTVFGNCLVIAAVWREKSLHSVCNYLIVSLAVSDLLVATCVMSFAVYFEWNSFIWDLGPALCNLYIGADVACSTASILNLLAISLDRYIAISHPLLYTQYGASNSRTLVSIFVVWTVSAGVAIPIFLGANKMDSGQQSCEFTNPFFIIISSLLSFFLPCAAMLALYAIIFRRLRQREKARRMRSQAQRTHAQHHQLHHQRQLLASMRRSHKLKSSQSDFALRIENERISSALLGGVRMAQQMGNHLKSRADQMLLELSLQVVLILPIMAAVIATSTSTDDFCSATTVSVSNNRKVQCNGGPTLIALPPNSRVLKMSTSVSGDTLLLGHLSHPTGRSSRLYSKHHRPAMRTASMAHQHLCRSNTMPLQRRPLSTPEGPSLPEMVENVNRLGSNEAAAGEEESLTVRVESRPGAEMVKNDALSASFGEKLQLEDCPFIDSISYEADGARSDCARRATTGVSEPVTAPRRMLTSMSALSFLYDMPSTRLDSAPPNWAESLSSVIPPPPPPVSPPVLSPPKATTIARNDTALSISEIDEAAIKPSRQLYQRRHIVTSVPRPLRLSISNSNLNALPCPSHLTTSDLPTYREDVDQTPPIRPSASVYSALNKTPTSMATSSGGGDDSTRRHHTGPSSDGLWTLFDFWRSLIAVRSGKNKGTTSLIDQSETLGRVEAPADTTVADTQPPMATDGRISRQGGLRERVSMTWHEVVWRNWLWCRLTSTLRRSAIRQVTVDKIRPSRHLVKKASKQMRREQKATVTLAVVLVVFLGCWVPFFLLHLANAICILTGRENCVHFLAMFLSTWLGYLNSSLNPLIYTLFDARFRKEFRTILRCQTKTHGG